MNRITELRQAKRGNRVNVFLDGKFALSLSVSIVSDEGLRCDQVLSDEQIQALSREDHYQRCLAVAANFLSYRPRSTAELRTRLSRRGFDNETQARVVESLKARGLLDDVAFAEFWTENRESFSPRSRRLTRMELQRKGVSRDVIEKAVESVDDAESAYRAASLRAGAMHWSDREQFRRRLGGYLERRGFGYAVIEAALERVWKEAGKEDEFSYHRY